MTEVMDDLQTFDSRLDATCCRTTPEQRAYMVDVIWHWIERELEPPPSPPKRRTARTAEPSGTTSDRAQP